MSQQIESKAFSLEFLNSAPDVPTPNDLLSLKLLKDTNEALFKPLYTEQTKFLGVARSLLMNDEWLASKFNGQGLESMSALASILKKRTEELNMHERVDGVLGVVLDAQLHNIASQPLGSDKTATKVQAVVQNKLGTLELQKSKISGVAVTVQA